MMVGTRLFGLTGVARNRWLLEAAILVAYVTIATALVGRLVSASVTFRSTDEPPSSTMLPTFTVPITVFSASCTDACVSVTIFCATRNAAAMTRPIVVDALEVEKIYHELDCQTEAN
jgi:hypothetical protein